MVNDLLDVVSTKKDNGRRAHVRCGFRDCTKLIRRVDEDVSLRDESDEQRLKESMIWV